MATATANLYTLPSQSDAQEEVENRRAEAKKRWGKLCKAGALQSVSSMEIGWNAYLLKRDNQFGLLGFADEEEARLASGVGQSTWYANIRLAGNFHGLTEEQFLSMKQANAKALSDLPESLRFSREWVRRAGSERIELFQEAVDEVMEGKAKPSDGKERGVTLKVSVPKSRKKVIEDGVKAYAEKVGMSAGDPGKVLEVLLVEQQGAPSLIAAITNSIQRIKVIKELQQSNVSAEEALEKINVHLDDMVLEFQAALDSVQNLEKQ